MLSEFLTAALTAIGKDVKAIFAKFDATGKLIKANLPTLTKSDVGLSNVDNTADASKSVARAGSLTAFRRIELTGDVTGYTNFNGSANTSIAATLNKTNAYMAVNSAPVVTAPAGNADTYPAGTKYYSKAPDNPFAPFAAFIETIQLEHSGNRVIQFAYGATITTTNVYDTGAGIMFRRFTVGGNNTPEQLAWRPISSSLITYNNTTNDAPNVTIGSDGILRRSTAAGTAPTVLKAVMGSPEGQLATGIPHGLNPARIKAVYAKVEPNVNYWVWQHYMYYDSTGAPNFMYFFEVSISGSIVYIDAHKDAFAVHGKPVTIFIETY